LAGSLKNSREPSLDKSGGVLLEYLKNSNDSFSKTASPAQKLKPKKQTLYSTDWSSLDRVPRRQIQMRHQPPLSSFDARNKAKLLHTIRNLFIKPPLTQTQTNSPKKGIKLQKRANSMLEEEPAER